MSKYDLNIIRLLSLLPFSLRKPKMLALVGVLLAPDTWLYNQFTTYRIGKEYRLSHTGQVYSLEQVICDYCDNQGCYITDGDLRVETLVPYSGVGELINNQVLLPADADILPQLSIHYEGDGFETYADFIVHLPAELYNEVDEIALCSLINEYKLAGKFYKIVYDNVMIARYEFAWSSDICVQEASYNFAWTKDTCTQELELYNFTWLKEFCVKINSTISKS